MAISQIKKSRVKLSISLGALMLMLYTALSGDPIECLVIFSAAFIHELGHILAAGGLKIKIKSLGVDLIGASMITERLGSYADEIILCGAGPLANLICFSLFYPLQRYLYARGIERTSYYILLFCGACLGLMMINLLPVRCFDGGRILHSVLSLVFGPRTADKALEISTLLCIGIMWMLSIYLILRYQSALSLFTFSLILFWRIFFNGRK